MKLRSALLGSLMFVTAITPVGVQAKSKDVSLAETAQKLRDPQFQNNLATVLALFSQSMMGMKLGPMAQAMDKMAGKDGSSGIDPNATLGDMMGADAQTLSQDMSAKLPAMMEMMAGMAGSMDAMMPQLKAMGEQLKKSMPRQ